MQKQKGKKGAKRATAGESSKDETTTEKPAGDDKPALETPGPEVVEQTPEPAVEQEEKMEEEQREQEQREEAPPEPMPDAPISPEAETSPDETKELPVRGAHKRQPSLSVQSKMRSSSFRNSISTAVSPGSSIKSPPLPPLAPGDEQIHEVFRRQTARVEELEKENKRLEKEFTAANAGREKAEEELEDLRESSVEVIELKDRLAKAKKQVAELESLVCAI
jgi:DNA repair exonuclease SbcCD ATPase subunit